MDSSLFTVVLVIAFFAAVIILKLTKGKRGEKVVSVLLSRLPKDEYRIINDLLLQNGGYSTQIDHVVVSPYGVFVIETKNYKGKIYGGENSENWTQKLYRKKYHLRNPLWQNRGHITAIRELLEANERIPFYSIVAFSNRARLRVDRSLPVMHWWSIVPYIKRFKQPVLSDSSVRDIYQTLITANITDRKSKREHVKSVRQKQRARDKAVANGICPLCGGELVRRSGQYGRFYGCSNYPRCKYILK